MLASVGVTVTGCQPAPADLIAERIVIALSPEPGEYAIVRYNADAQPAVSDALARALEARGAEVELLPYGPVSDFDQRIAGADIYVRLPDPTGDGTTAEQQLALANWLDAGRGRQVHFHWGAGTMGADGVPGEHSPVYDALYLDALAVDYQELDRHQDVAIEALKSGLVRVTTPAGTDLTFEVRDRPFNKQNGDASRRQMARARTRIDREIELPAGVVRVAPIETSVTGALVVPFARFPGGNVHGLRLQFERGAVTTIEASEGAEFVRTAVTQMPALTRFRELGIGFNPVLRPLPDEQWIPYYGYGEGVVRLSLGNNRELGGEVDGVGVRWFFFPDATVRVGQQVIIEDGELVMVPHLSGISLLGTQRD